MELIYKHEIDVGHYWNITSYGGPIPGPQDGDSPSDLIDSMNDWISNFHNESTVIGLSMIHTNYYDIKQVAEVVNSFSNSTLVEMFTEYPNIHTFTDLSYVYQYLHSISNTIEQLLDYDCVDNDDKLNQDITDFQKKVQSMINEMVNFTSHDIMDV